MLPPPNPRGILRKHLPSVSKTTPIRRPCSHAPLQLLFTSSREAGMRVSIMASHIDTHLWRRVGVLRSLADEGTQYITHTRDCCRESCSLFAVLRHRTPSSPIGLSEVIHKPFALSRVFLLFSGGESVILVKKKAPSRSDILLSTHVVLKTRHVNPNIHVRRY